MITWNRNAYSEILIANIMVGTDVSFTIKWLKFINIYCKHITIVIRIKFNVLFMLELVFYILLGLLLLYNLW